MSKTVDYVIKDYTTGDEEAIITLFNEVFGQTITPMQWRWKFRGAGLNNTIYAKLAFDSRDNLLGFAGAIPLQGYCRGESLPIFQICDVMVHPLARGYLGPRNVFTGLLRQLLDSIAQQHPKAFCYGFPGRRPFLLGQRARVYEKVENAIEITRQPSRRRVSLLSVKALDWADARLDNFWKELIPRNSLLVARDRIYLNWRYATNLSHNYQLLGVFGLRILLGWAVVRQQQDQWLIVDMLCKRRWLSPILRAIDHAALAAGIQTSKIWLPANWREAASGEQTTTEVVTTHMIWKPNFTTAMVRENLYYTMGDLDIF